MRRAASFVWLLFASHAQLGGGAAHKTCAERIKATASGGLGGLSSLCQARRAESGSETRQEVVVDRWMSRDYDRLTRPALASRIHTLDKGDSIKGEKVWPENISVGLFANQVWDIDQRAGSFKVQSQLRLLWRDDRLCFNGAQLHNPHINLDEQSMQNLTTGVSILQGLWLPDVHFQNSIQSGEDEKPDAQLLRVNECGEVTWARRFIVTLWVAFDFKKLPFDKQTLKIDLESYRMPVDDASTQPLLTTTLTQLQGHLLTDTDRLCSQVVLKWTGGCDKSSDYTGIAPQTNPEWGFQGAKFGPFYDIFGLMFGPFFELVCRSDLGRRHSR